MNLSLPNLQNLNGSDGWSISGISAGDRLGTSVHNAGDINNDGFDDVIVSAIDAGILNNDPFSFSASDRRGEVYVIFGKAGGFNNTFDLSSLDGSNGFKISGNDANHELGQGISVGDLNGDGIDDLAISAPNAGLTISDFGFTFSESNGEVYVIFGQQDAFTPEFNLNSLSGSNGFTLKGIDAEDLLGSTITSSGDLNGDGIEDLVVSAAGGGQLVTDGNGFTSSDRRGEVYVIFGNNDDFDARPNLFSLDGNNGFIIDGQDPNDGLGSALSNAGDINGDGIDDLIIGAANAGEVIDDPFGGGFNDQKGEIYVVFGRKGGFNSRFNISSQLNGTDGFAISGISAEDNLGHAVTNVGDINGDSIEDLVITAENASVSGEFTEEGQAYVIFGRQEGFESQFELNSLNGTNGFSIAGINSDDSLGDAISVGDFNGDKIDDLFIGASTAGETISEFGFNVSARRGEAYIILGKQDSFSAQVDLSNLGPNSGGTIIGLNRDDLLGSAIASGGDINNDGVADLIVSAPEADSNLEDTQEGKAYIIYGSTSEVQVDDRPQILGTNQADQIEGGSSKNTISGLSGNDTINGNGGNDVIGGNNGNDRLAGQSGDDRLFGGDGNDILDGGQGKDTLVGQFGNDVLSGGSENDVLHGNEDNDTLNGNDGNDQLNGGLGNDFLDGQLGNDRLAGAVGNDQLNGGGGNDFLSGAKGNDTLNGNDGNDTLKGHEGNDILNAQGDDDLLVGGNGNDTLLAGPGNDSLIGQNGIDILNGESGDDTLDGGRQNDILRGESGADILRGGPGNDELFGGTGNDRLVAGDGDDTLNGTEANHPNSLLEEQDTLIGGSGAELFILGQGETVFYDDQDPQKSGNRDYAVIENLNLQQDRIQLGGNRNSYELSFFTDSEGKQFANIFYLGASELDAVPERVGVIDHVNPSLTLNDPTFIFDGQDSTDIPVDDRPAIFGTNQSERIEGGSSNNRISGLSGDDTLNGNDGNDTLGGNDGNDSLGGQGGNDRLFGSNGDDFLSGGIGNDLLNGGVGNDTLDGMGTEISTPQINQQDTLAGGAGADLFILGVDEQVFYNDDNASSKGTGDYALIKDFNPQQDQIQLGSSRSSYELSFLDNAQGTTVTNILYLEPGKTPEVIGIIENAAVDLDLDSSAFSFGQPETSNINSPINGTPFQDQLSGNDGNDVINGDNGDDTLSGNGGNDIINGDGGGDTVFSGGGNDTVFGGDNNDTLFGGGGSDFLRGGNNQDQLAGDNDDDFLEGGTDNDLLQGGNGNDTLNGTEAGNLNLQFGEQDTLVGGLGEDLFILGDKEQVYYSDRNPNTEGSTDYALIEDFNSGEDIIQLAGTRSQYGMSFYTDATGNLLANIFYLAPGEIPERIGILNDISAELNLDDSSFSFI